MTQVTHKPKALHFGAGNIGRGFIGALLVNSGYHVVFSDVDKHLIDELNNYASYHVHILEPSREYEEPVEEVSGVADPKDTINGFADPDMRLVTTAVGPTVLEKIAPTIARGIAVRRRRGGGALNVIACENMVGQTAFLRRCVVQHLQEDEDRKWADTNVGFANCSVDRIVPPYHSPSSSDDGSADEGNPLDIGVEGFYEWVVDASGLRTPLEPPVHGMHLTHDLDAYIERKLFTLNCGHAITAYLGFLRHVRTIDQAIQDPEIRRVVEGALAESGAALVRKHKFDPREHEQYVHRIMQRFSNEKLQDDVVRVGRQPLRKLAEGDRLIGPTRMARNFGLPIDNLARGIAAALLYDIPSDEQSRELQKKIGDLGIELAVTEITGFEKDTEEHSKVVGAYFDLSENYVLRH